MQMQFRKVTRKFNLKPFFKKNSGLRGSKYSYNVRDKELCIVYTLETQKECKLLVLCYSALQQEFSLVRQIFQNTLYIHMCVCVSVCVYKRKCVQVVKTCHRFLHFCTGCVTQSQNLCTLTLY